MTEVSASRWCASLPIAAIPLKRHSDSHQCSQETFEALSALSSHGLPKLIAVLTHLDLVKSPAALKAQKKRLKKRFWTEVYDGAKMFYLSGVMNGRYPDREILNLSRYGRSLTGDIRTNC